MADTPRETANRLVNDLRAVLDARIQCAVLYGSAARDEYVPGVSDVNVMILLDDIHPRTLALAAPVASKWARAGHTPPLIMEREQWNRAHDVFAIELADMRDAHEALLGEDCVAGTVIDRGDLRVQAERELRGKLLQLQTGLLMATKSDVLGDLLKKALPSFTTYLRAVIRLSGTAVPGSTPDVIKAGAGIVKTSADAWLTVWNARVRRETLRLALTDALVEEYHTAAEQTAAYVDHLREDDK